METTKHTKIVSILLAIIMIIGIIPISCLTTAAAAAEKVEPTEPAFKDGFYQLSNVHELYWFAQQVNSGKTDINAKLTQDIVVNEYNYNNVWTPMDTFSGIFDGCGHAICGLYIENKTLTKAGLFSTLKGEVKDLSLIYTKFIVNNEVGSFCNINEGKITRCYNYGEVRSLYHCVGGICAENRGTITACIASGVVAASGFYAGGICGENVSGTIDSCYVKNICVTAGYPSYCGSIYGGIENGTVSNCYYEKSYGNYNKHTVGTPTITNVSQKSDYAFRSGEVAYLLNKGITDGTQPFYQNVDNGKSDEYPTFENTGNNTVFGSEQDGHPFYTNIENSKLELKRDSDGNFIISSYEDLCTMAEKLNSNDIHYAAGDFVLTNDIECMNSKPWVPVNHFDKTFYGNGHSISYLNPYSEFDDNEYHGLFKTIGFNGVVKNLNLVHSGVNLRNSDAEGTGAIAGVNLGTIEKCVVDSAFIKAETDAQLGGIVGINEGIINNCAVLNTILSRKGDHEKTMGGIAETNSGTIKNSYTYNTNYIDGDTTTRGGIIARGNDVDNCYYYTSSKVNPAFGTAKTLDQFYNGEVTYHLNKGVIDGTQVWYQNLMQGSRNVYPVFNTPLSNAKIVFKHDDIYNNTPSARYLITEDNHKLLDVPERYIGFYPLESIDDLYWFAEQINSGKNIRAYLANDIVNTDKSREWTPIGTSTHGFEGVLDGCGHTISGLHLTGGQSALFWYSNGTIKDLILADTHFKSGDNGHWLAAGFTIYNYGLIENCTFNGTVTGDTIGGICVFNEGTIRNCTNNGEIYSEKGYAGGICGFVNTGTIANCVNNGKITSVEVSAAGIVCANQNKIFDCVNNGEVVSQSTTDDFAGGICASAGKSSTILNCSNFADIHGIDYAGGICGFSWDRNTLIENCVNTGTIYGKGYYIGGICGYYKDIEIINCTDTGSIVKI